MKSNRFIIFVFSLFVLASTLVLPVAAQTDELSQKKIDAIQDHCVSAQTAIQRTRESDLVVRSNQGRSYEYILSLMASLNSRIALNKLAQPRMTEITSELQSRFEQYHDHYTGYTVAVDEALAIGCQREPAKFYQALTTIREQRSRLAEDTATMRELIDEYAGQVQQLREEIRQ